MHTTTMNIIPKSCCYLKHEMGTANPPAQLKLCCYYKNCSKYTRALTGKNNLGDTTHSFRVSMGHGLIFYRCSLLLHFPENSRQVNKAHRFASSRKRTQESTSTSVDLDEADLYLPILLLIGWSCQSSYIRCFDLQLRSRNYFPKEY